MSDQQNVQQGEVASQNQSTGGSKGASSWMHTAYRGLTQGWGSFVFAILLALSIRWALIEAYVIPSASMLPSLLLHDHIFVNKLTFGLRVPFTEKWLWQFRIPERGEVIVFKYPRNKETFFIKRVIGLPGDKIYYENGRLFVNDKAIETTQPGSEDDWRMLSDTDFQKEDFQNPLYGTDSKAAYDHFTEKLSPEHPHSILLRKDGGYSRTEGPWTVPDGHLFMMGDNRDNSHDSRRWGFLPIENILGKAMFVWLTCESTVSGAPFLCDPTTIRWSRMFHTVN